MGFWQFANENPFTAVIIAMIAGGVARSIIYLQFLTFNRWMRSRNIAARGWPTNPIMDADGDIMRPDTEK